MHKVNIKEKKGNIENYKFWLYLANTYNKYKYSEQSSFISFKVFSRTFYFGQGKNATQSSHCFHCLYFKVFLCSFPLFIWLM